MRVREGTELTFAAEVDAPGCKETRMLWRRGVGGVATVDRWMTVARDEDGGGSDDFSAAIIFPVVMHATVCMYRGGMGLVVFCVFSLQINPSQDLASRKKGIVRIVPDERSYALGIHEKKMCTRETILQQ